MQSIVNYNVAVLMLYVLLFLKTFITTLFQNKFLVFKCKLIIVQLNEHAVTTSTNNTITILSASKLLHKTNNYLKLIIMTHYLQM